MENDPEFKKWLKDKGVVYAIYYPLFINIYRDYEEKCNTFLVYIYKDKENYNIASNGIKKLEDTINYWIRTYDDDLISENDFYDKLKQSAFPLLEKIFKEATFFESCEFYLTEHVQEEFE